jgi:hypothetical protein
MQTSLKRLVTVAACVPLILLAAEQAAAQESRGAILGRVVDTSGAAIPAVTVKATNLNTNVSVSGQSNASGNYEIPYLLPGPYQLSAELPGFKSFVREGIELRLADRVTVEVVMQVGDIAEKLTVTAETPLLETATAGMGQVIDHRRILELPVAHGNPYLLMALSAGVAHTQNPGLDQPYAPTHIVGYSMDGVRANRSEIAIDGTPNTVVNHRWGRGDLMAGYTPPADVVQELKVQTAAFDAGVGHSQGGITSITLKSGTNELHGSAYYSMLNPALDANLYFSNAARLPRGEYEYHRFGGSFMGPVYIPKLYNGRDRTFFTYAYEQIRDSRARGAVYTVPDERERAGDFSALLALGSQYQIYDPATRTAVEGGRFQSQPLPNNIVPRSRISPIAEKILGYIPMPNATGLADGTNNLNRTDEPEVLRYYNNVARVDHNFSLNHRMYVRFNNYNRGSTYYDYFKSLASGGVNDWPQHALSIDDVFHFNPSTFLNVRYAGYRLSIGISPKQESIGFDLTSLGLPKYLNDASSASERTFPHVSVTNYFSTISEWYTHNHQNHTLEGHLTAIRGRHSLRFGGDARQYRTFHVELGRTSTGSFQFGTAWTQGPFNTSPASPKGQGLAGMLLGLPTGGNVDRNASYAEQSTEYSFYIHDDWRVNSRLTLNLGIRYEVESPLTERFNRTVRGFDFTTPNPLEAQARANYAANPIPELPADQFRFTGGLTFPGVGGQPRGLWKRDTNNFMPRVGFAFQASPKTVLRGGWGMFFGPLGARRVDVIQDGFSQSTPLIPSLDNGLTFVATLADPFPDGIQQPPGASNGLLTFAGRSISFFNENPVAPYHHRWQFSIQRELPHRALVELGYIGNSGRAIETTYNFRALPLQYLSRLPVRDQTTINYLAAQVRNPFSGLLPGTGLAGTTVSRSHLLSSGPYTGYTGMSMLDNSGYSRYHAMSARVEKRFSRGWTSHVAYTWSKNMEALNRLNGQYDNLEYVVSDQDRAHRIVVSAIFELPIGRGRALLGSASRVTDAFLGGWQVQGIFTGQGGQALAWGNLFFRGDDVHAITLPVSQRTPDRWFNTDAGFVRASAEQPGSNFRLWPSRLNNVRGDGVNQWDLSALKNVRLKERLTGQFRAEFLNALNHPNFNNPNTGVTSAAFGRVTSQKGFPRRVQFGFKVLF